MTTSSVRTVFDRLGPEYSPLDAGTRAVVAQFLFVHLDEYGDSLADIQACLDYAEERGGAVFAAYDGDELLGASITNRTGMQGFIPENILVYIAVHADARGKGVGKSLMEAITSALDGSIALHVEPQNPAKALYEKYGFTNKYLEMRLTR
ncbi:GNAT family N-acetyltransferase [Deinococcus radiophilus]|uniref:N-acetyltransferase n=1 Tax=Deinococcus radiophilus TaxID=32062 RepID=A0A431VG09_9DEIO|nr:GNAT family N-acetyltransferase [Deinococcus radiophilus]RTR19417.1 N-acetyltransferase [Deinococcus radiophilus]UFA50233.1 GNAT family N-acetyltransferase [Deinococcus radiophilus]